MKTMTNLLMTASIPHIPSSAQEEKKFAEQTIVQFVKGTANRDLYSMHYLLHENFQAVLSEDESSIVSKSEYMKLLSAKVLGGEDQDVEIISLDVATYTAAAKVKITSRSDMFEAWYQLFMSVNGSWQILHIIPFAEVKM
jgi:hypothetical protein